MLGDVTKLFDKKFVDIALQYFSFTSQRKFPAHNLNFEGEGEGDGIESRLPFKSFSALKHMS